MSADAAHLRGRETAGTGLESTPGLRARRDRMAPSAPVPTEVAPPVGARPTSEKLDHELVGYDLDHLDDSERWKLGLGLGHAGIAHEWKGTTLWAPSTADVLVQRTEQAHESISHQHGPPHDLEAADQHEGEERSVVASPMRRASAAIIDNVILVLPGVILSVAWSTTTMVGNITVTKPATGAWVLWDLTRTAYLIVGIGGFSCTPGQALLGLRVVDGQGGPAGWRRATLRFVVPNLAWIVVWAAATPAPVARWAVSAWDLCVYLPIVFDSRRRGLHDRAAGRPERLWFDERRWLVAPNPRSWRRISSGGASSRRPASCAPPARSGPGCTHPPPH